MTPEEEKIYKLTRIGKETIIKNGTYEMYKARAIVQDHPFYDMNKVDSNALTHSALTDQGLKGDSSKESTETILEAADVLDSAPPMSDDEIASSIISSNFKVGLTQEEVDALLGTL